MCIRDRLQQVRSSFEVTTGQLVARGGHGGLESQTALRSLSVSYTHLRAHETVLDIVCRLLLEKKKDKHNTTIHLS